MEGICVVNNFRGPLQRVIEGETQGSVSSEDMITTSKGIRGCQKNISKKTSLALHVPPPLGAPPTPSLHVASLLPRTRLSWDSPSPADRTKNLSLKSNNPMDLSELGWTQSIGLDPV